jgi:hypothetical protein
VSKEGDKYQVKALYNFIHKMIVPKEKRKKKEKKNIGLNLMNYENLPHNKHSNT